MSSESISLYFHIPFCERKCIYCDFYSIEDQSAQSRFIDALCKEIDLKIKTYPSLDGKTVDTIFFGGGTPSLLTPSEFEQIVKTIHRHFTLSDNIEFTLECNPGTVTLEKLSAYKALGANRLSFGVQSFHQDELDWLSRIHSAQDARDAVAIARAAGFDNVNIDLMFALPGQTKEKLAYSLQEAIALGTEHISAYNLTVEEGTPLNRMVKLHQVNEMPVDDASEMYELVQETMTSVGYHQYEISNYSKSESLRCKHNLVYWDGYKKYISFGPSAHEFFGSERSWNLSSLDQYLKRIESQELPRNNSEHPAPDERRTEVLFCGLRSIGVDIKHFKASFNEDLIKHPEIESLLAEGLVTITTDRIALTTKGYRYCDAIVVRLMEPLAVA
ncbi:MAG TPA: radical SAM family heme chaperone HemW [Candidatus Kapabacteria bacterium]|nr:radical SAM family heme chaperone HemW [Candidatus Kapabacteria bacterium]